jgi:hypothetical protein
MPLDLGQAEACFGFSFFWTIFWPPDLLHGEADNLSVRIWHKSLLLKNKKRKKERQKSRD